MKAKIQIPQDILASIDYANTVNGGMSETCTKVNQVDNGYEVVVKSPGLEAESFHIDIANGMLNVYHLIKLFTERPEGMDNLLTTRTLGRLVLPNDVDNERIEARYDSEERHLHIILPFNPKRHQRREIEIDRQ